MPTITFRPKPVQSTSYTQFICPIFQINQAHSSSCQNMRAAGPSKILAMIYQIKCCQYYHSISMWAPSLHFSTKILYIFTFPHTCYMYHLSHPSWFSPPKNNSMWSRSDAAVDVPINSASLFEESVGQPEGTIVAVIVTLLYNNHAGT